MGELPVRYFCIDFRYHVSILGAQILGIFKITLKAMKTCNLRGFGPKILNLQNHVEGHGNTCFEVVLAKIMTKFKPYFDTLYLFCESALAVWEPDLTTFFALANVSQEYVVWF